MATEEELQHKLSIFLTTYRETEDKVVDAKKRLQGLDKAAKKVMKGRISEWQAALKDLKKEITKINKQIDKIFK